jgi:hypothetical protein
VPAWVQGPKAPGKFLRLFLHYFLILLEWVTFWAQVGQNADSRGGWTQHPLFLDAELLPPFFFSHSSFFYFKDILSFPFHKKIIYMYIFSAFCSPFPRPKKSKHTGFIILTLHLLLHFWVWKTAIILYDYKLNHHNTRSHWSTNASLSTGYWTSSVVGGGLDAWGRSQMVQDISERDQRREG